MILSASRRTDIPNYYSTWFFNRIKAGFLYVRNPMNAHQIISSFRLQKRHILDIFADKVYVYKDKTVITFQFLCDCDK